MLPHEREDLIMALAFVLVAVLIAACLFAVQVAPSQCIDPGCGDEPSQTGSPTFTF